MSRSTFITTILLAFTIPLALFAQDATNQTQTDQTTQTQTQLNLQGSATANFSSSYAFQRNGIFGCSLSGSYSMSVGALSAVGGVYVPVNDAAVTLNTGYLVYKECVLRGVVDRMRENQTASLTRAIGQAYQNGRNGLPLYSQSTLLEQRNVYDKTLVQSIQSGYLNTLSPAFRQPVQRAVVQGYMLARNQPNQAFACPSANNYWDNLGNLSFNPACNSYGAKLAVENAIYSNAADKWNEDLAWLQWGNGSYPRTVIDPNTGEEIVVTPSYLVSQGATQALTSGFRQLENANDIDQMVGALFTGITTQLVSDTQGLAGLTQQQGSQPSYLDRVVQSSVQGLRDSAANVALQNLAAAQQVEQGYVSLMQDIATILQNAITGLQTKENACWKLIIQNVCATPVSNSNTCTAKSGACTTDPETGQQNCPTAVTLKIATTTVASQAIISTKISPLATTTAQNIASSQQTLAQIAQLIAAVTNSAVPGAQLTALQQLDQLATAHALHNQYDLQQAQQSKTDIGASMDQLQTDTAQMWGDNTDPTIGWCNVQNQAVLTYWKQKWSQ